MPATETRELTASERAASLAASVQLASESGYGETTVESILERAELDRAAFDRFLSA